MGGEGGREGKFGDSGEGDEGFWAAESSAPTERRGKRESSTKAERETEALGGTGSILLLLAVMLLCACGAVFYFRSHILQNTRAIIA